MKITTNKLQERTNYLLIVLLLISSSVSTSLLGQSLVFIFISFLFTFFISYRRGIKVNKNIYFLFAFVVIYYLVYLVGFSAYNPLFSVKVVLFLLYAFYIVSVLNLKLFYYLKNTVYVLALISLPLYALQILMYSELYSLIESIQNSIPFLNREVLQTANILVWGIQKGGNIYRNSGFMWEPGGFAAMLLLPIMFEFIYSKFKFSRKVIIMIIALLTTLSTMGYIALLVIFLWVMINLKVKYLPLLIPIVSIVIPIILGLPFMRDKILKEYNSTGSTIKRSITSNYKIASFARMASAIMDFRDWQKNPFFGIGGQQEEISYFGSNGQRWVNRTNGLSNYLLVFGLLGFSLLIYNMHKSFILISNVFHIRGAYFFIIIIFILAFSNTLLITPIFLVYQLTYLATEKGEIEYLV